MDRYRVLWEHSGGRKYTVQREVGDQSREGCREGGMSEFGSVSGPTPILLTSNVWMLLVQIRVSSWE